MAIKIFAVGIFEEFGDLVFYFLLGIQEIRNSKFLINFKIFERFVEDFEIIENISILPFIFGVRR